MRHFGMGFISANDEDKHDQCKPDQADESCARAPTEEERWMLYWVMAWEGKMCGLNDTPRNEGAIVEVLRAYMCWPHRFAGPDARILKLLTGREVTTAWDVLSGDGSLEFKKEMLRLLHPDPEVRQAECARMLWHWRALRNDAKCPCVGWPALHLHILTAELCELVWEHAPTPRFDNLEDPQRLDWVCAQIAAQEARKLHPGDHPVQVTHPDLTTCAACSEAHPSLEFLVSFLNKKDDTAPPLVVQRAKLAAWIFRHGQEGVALLLGALDHAHLWLHADVTPPDMRMTLACQTVLTGMPCAALFEHLDADATDMLRKLAASVGRPDIMGLLLTLDALAAGADANRWDAPRPDLWRDDPEHMARITALLDNSQAAWDANHVGRWRHLQLNVVRWGTADMLPLLPVSLVEWDSDVLRAVLARKDKHAARMLRALLAWRDNQGEPVLKFAAPNHIFPWANVAPTLFDILVAERFADVVPLISCLPDDVPRLRVQRWFEHEGPKDCIGPRRDFFDGKPCTCRVCVAKHTALTRLVGADRPRLLKHALAECFPAFEQLSELLVSALGHLQAAAVRAIAHQMGLSVEFPGCIPPDDVVLSTTPDARRVRRVLQGLPTNPDAMQALTLMVVRRFEDKDESSHARDTVQALIEITDSPLAVARAILTHPWDFQHRSFFGCVPSDKFWARLHTFQADVLRDALEAGADALDLFAPEFRSMHCFKSMQPDKAHVLRLLRVAMEAAERQLGPAAVVAAEPAPAE